ncbi:DNA-processing protein DprA [Microbulbifer sp. 2205BS26-8]|uniref:DNA-processing protein DprA n=1 Tax=Microbulbifer sp. 2205BS26-8 TaxID=3064386 RepID=UPI00273E33A6|nr:DNA-processing protein DprA [Microbulbifer sp. 2205BS26-8]MDP5209872.1 DNA-processing protein DprA [Microbulbifer sp. 2205BS26-8]
MDGLTACMALLRLEGIGPSRYWRLVEHFGNPLAALRQVPSALLDTLPVRAQSQWREFSRLDARSALVAWAEEERERCADSGVQLLWHGDPGYPALLTEISRPPPVLYIRGAHRALGLPQIAIVGARRATTTGLDNACAFAAELARAGFAITSGLALGVDAAAHRGALRGGGTTLAVLGSGVDRIYPRHNRSLAEDILVNGGALISELPLGSNAEAKNFPRRNRIISGLSMGVLLTEAALHSGSLITARLALEQNREVFAIPGSIHNPMARGCHQLIKTGATLVETSAEIATQLGGLLAEPATETVPEALPDRRQQALVDALTGGLRSIEQLALDTGQNPGELMGLLLQMELDGLLEPLPGGYQLTARGATYCHLVASTPMAE